MVVVAVIEVAVHIYITKSTSHKNVSSDGKKCNDSGGNINYTLLIRVVAVYDYRKMHGWKSESIGL